MRSDCYLLQLTAEDEERRRRRRERNKIAATKCRLKKRERTVNLVQVGVSWDMNGLGVPADNEWVGILMDREPG
jgi:hypothetical protein